MKKRFFFIFFISNNINAECIKKDLTDPDYLREKGKENLIEHFQKPQDQDSIGWCGAYASADSLSFSIGEAISPVDVSVNYYSNNSIFDGTRLENLRGIMLDAAATMSQAYGYCPESVIPSNQSSSSNLGHSAIFRLMNSFQKIYDEYKANENFIDECFSCKEDYINVIKPSLPGVTENLIKTILLKNHKDSKDFFGEVLDKLCEGKRKKITPQVERIPRMTLLTKTVARVLNEALDNDSIPSIQINTSFFADPKAVPGGNGEHGMTIVARRMGNNNKCEYLVRNSWGKGCNYYQQKIKDKCDPTKGSFWMDEEELQKTVQFVVVIKDDKKNQKLNYVLKAPQEENRKIDLSATNTNIITIPNTDTKTLTEAKIDNSNTISSPNIYIDKKTITNPSIKKTNRFSNFFRSIWRSFSKAFRY